MAKVLLLESDKLLADSIAKALKHSGHDTDWQVEPQAAIHAADQHRPDIIILDVMLARRSGIEFLYELRSYEDWQAIPVIIYSSLPATEMPTIDGTAKHLNVAAYLHKVHGSLAELQTAVNRLVGVAAKA